MVRLLRKSVTRSVRYASSTGVVDDVRHLVEQDCILWAMSAVRSETDFAVSCCSFSLSNCGSQK